MNADPAAQARERLLRQVWSRLRCPACGQAMPCGRVAVEITCGACSARYPVLTTRVPGLLHPDRAEPFKAILKSDAGGICLRREYRGLVHGGPDFAPRSSLPRSYPTKTSLGNMPGSMTRVARILSFSASAEGGMRESLCHQFEYRCHRFGRYSGGWGQHPPAGRIC